MKTQANHTKTNESQAVSNHTANQAAPAAGVPRQAVSKNNLHTLANSSPQITQLRSYQSMANNRHVLQRFPTAMTDAEAKESSSFHRRGHTEDGEEIPEEDLTQGAIDEIKAGVFILSGHVNCNCFGWALGEDGFVSMGDLGDWMRRQDGYEYIAPDAADAKIILWGNKNGEEDEDKWDVLHASVRLSHQELLVRSGEFSGFAITEENLEASDVEDPTWTSAAGMGFPITAHPRNWYDGGDFGEALKGMK